MFETKISKNTKIVKKNCEIRNDHILTKIPLMSARQMVFLASQGNKIIQNPPKIEQFCTILKQHFQASGWSSKLSFDGNCLKSTLEK